MAFDSKKTILLEKTYLYVRASLGFQLEGTSTEKIPTNNGFYRFFVDNLQKSIGNSYVNILYDSQDLTLQCFCSDLYMDELMSSDSSAIEDVVEELKKNTTTITEFENGVSSALESNHQDNVALNAKIEEFESGVSSALAANHEDNVSIQTTVSSINDIFSKNQNYLDLSCNLLTDHNQPSSMPNSGNLVVSSSDFIKGNRSNNKYYAHYHYDCYNSIYPNLFLSFAFGDSVYLSTYKPDRLYYTIKYINSSGSIVYKRGYEEPRLGTGSTAMTVVINSAFTLLSMDFFLISFEAFVSALNFYDGKIFSDCSFSDNILFLKPYGNISSSCFQNFDFDFSGGALDFRFFSSLSLDFLNSFTYTFLTDVGEFSFDGSNLGLKRISNHGNLIICTNMPVFTVPSGSPFTIKKLLGIRVSKSGSF